VNRTKPSAAAGLAVVAFLTSNLIFAKSDDPLTLRWAELHSVLKGRHIAVPLGNGAVVEGNYSSVEVGALVIEVTKSNNSVRHPKGMTSLPRTEVTQLTIKRHAGVKGRVIGLLVGGAIAGLVSLAGSSEGTGISGEKAGAIVAPIGVGFGLGWLLDIAGSRPKKAVRVLPGEGSQ